MSFQGMGHIGRSWFGHHLEDACPCPKAPCGLAISGSYDCPQHSVDAAKTLRQMHDDEHCPAVVWTDLPDGIHQKGVLVLTEGDNVTVKGFVRPKPGMHFLEDPQAIRFQGHETGPSAMPESPVSPPPPV